MKIDEFKKAIKHLIREEVKKTVAEEVNKAMGRILVEMVKEVKSNKLPITETIEQDETEQEEIVKQVPIINTKNSKLNSVLAETARNFKPLKKTVDSGVNFSSLMDGNFEKIGQTEDLNISTPSTKMDFLKQIVGESYSPANQPSALDGGSEVPDILKKVFKKDFRAIMRKMDEQKKSGTAGYIDSSRIIAG